MLWSLLLSKYVFVELGKKIIYFIKLWKMLLRMNYTKLLAEFWSLSKFISNLISHPFSIETNECLMLSLLVNSHIIANKISESFQHVLCKITYGKPCSGFLILWFLCATLHHSFPMRIKWNKKLKISLFFSCGCFHLVLILLSQFQHTAQNSQNSNSSGFERKFMNEAKSPAELMWTTNDCWWNQE